MSFLSNILGKKKKQLKATCAVSKEPVEKGYGYMLSTAQVISSKKFWDNVMTEPETMSYTISHFKQNDEMATRMRSMIFEKHSSVDKPWMVSDSIIHLFDVDVAQARKFAQNWWESEGTFIPNHVQSAQDELGNAFEEIKRYAIMQAGSERVVA